MTNTEKIVKYIVDDGKAEGFDMTNSNIALAHAATLIEPLLSTQQKQGVIDAVEQTLAQEKTQRIADLKQALLDEGESHPYLTS